MSESHTAIQELTQEMLQHEGERTLSFSGSILTSHEPAEIFLNGQRLQAERITLRMAEPELDIKSLPVPEKHAIAVADGAPSASYIERATKLGIRSAAILGAQLEAILADEFIPVFDYVKVREYLDQECLKQTAASYAQSRQYGLSYERKQWFWKPVRKSDRSKSALGMISHISYEVYQQAIPEPVLMTIEKISNRLPEAKFFVSEIVGVLDPFLAVTVPGASKMWVVERWDEPRFRG